MKHEDIVEDKKLIKKAVGMHDKQLHGGKKTKLSGLKKVCAGPQDRRLSKQYRIDADCQGPRYWRGD